MAATEQNYCFAKIYVQAFTVSSIHSFDEMKTAPGGILANAYFANGLPFHKIRYTTSYELHHVLSKNCQTV